MHGEKITLPPTRLKTLLWIILGAALIFMGGYAFSYAYTAVSAVLLVGYGILCYVVFAWQAHSLIDMRAIFSGVWLVGIGLACMRFNINQFPWRAETWLCYFWTYAAFLAGYHIRSLCSVPLLPVMRGHLFGLRLEKRILSEKGFFYGIVLLFSLTFGSFLLEAAVLGFLPLFSDEMDAYTRFHISGVHYFTVSCVLVFPFSYYYSKAYHPSRWKKAALWTMNLLSAAIPLLIVSRQLYFLQVLLGMFILISYGKKNELLSGATALLIALIGWSVLSLFRNQNAVYLQTVFDAPFSIGEAVPLEEKEDLKQRLFYQGMDYAQYTESLPPKLYHPYMYVCFNFDNFNYVVVRQTQYTFGAQTLFPFIALSGLKWIFPQLTDVPQYRLNPVYTTYPILYPAYSDFGMVGVLLYMLAIGFACRSVEQINSKYVFHHILNALMKYSLIFSFFTSFFANATMWFYFLSLFFIHLITNFALTKKGSSPESPF